jgi:hypothetical protein
MCSPCFAPGAQEDNAAAASTTTKLPYTLALPTPAGTGPLEYPAGFDPGVHPGGDPGRCDRQAWRAASEGEPGVTSP